MEQVRVSGETTTELFDPRPNTLTQERGGAFVYDFAKPVKSDDDFDTPVGYKVAGSGRAIVYAGGAVKWKPDGGIAAFPPIKEQ